MLSNAVPKVGTLGWYAMPRWGTWDESSNGSHPLFLALSSPMVPRMPLEWVFVMAGAQKNGPEHMCSGPRSSNNNF